MSPSAEPTDAPSAGPKLTGATLVRFTRAERLVHRSVAILMITCMTTAAIMYNGFLSAPVGHRRFVKLVHVYSGFALPVPIILGIVSAAYRADLRRLNRFSPTDWRWLRSRTRRDGAIRVGKFNAGQKLNTALSGGAIAVLLASGTIMYFPDLTRLAWRTGSTFVHDWFALALGLLVLGHIRFAVGDPGSRRGMSTGTVTVAWAERHHAAWADESSTQPDPLDSDPGSTVMIDP
ncbi:MAG: fdnI [Acidimicrobiales bacterium]|nr:fdnI [Acidimicrobiales bacterium]